MDAVGPGRAVAPLAKSLVPTAATPARKTAQDFEAVFLGQMTALMMETAQSDGDFTGGHGEEMFRGVLAEKLGTAITARGGIGLAPLVMNQIIKMQEGTGDGR